MEEKKEIFGCFVSCPASIYDPNESEEEALSKQAYNSELCKSFRNYIWGEKGISDTLKKLKNETYGNDMSIILFQFYVKPIPYLQQGLKEIESYRKNEKSIGIPIIVNDENFFSKSEDGRYSYLNQSILQKLDILAEVVKKKKLDTKMEQLKADLEKLLN